LDGIQAQGQVNARPALERTLIDAKLACIFWQLRRSFRFMNTTELLK
jgi:hypothetical protein